MVSINRFKAEQMVDVFKTIITMRTQRPGLVANAVRKLIINVTLSHLRSKESTGIHKPCIPALFPLPRVHLKVDQRVQRNNFPGVHLNVPQYTSGCIPGKLFL